ncbi:MAG: nucleotidyltransferase domain-containing protein [Paludibacteraceae bacterium]|nr:nucleotidyltransferase domain-containing protein [Paludibacteraceae bacterium]
MDIPFIEDIRKYIATQPVVRMWVFGSCSRGEAGDNSDVDFLVQYDRNNSHVGLFAMIQIKQELQRIIGREVDLVEEGTLMPFAVESANTDKILIYER